MVYEGLIIGFAGNKAIVITDDRQYLSIRRENSMYIGQKVIFDIESVIRRTNVPAKFISIAACILILFGIITFLGPMNQLMTSSKEYAFVDIDINPSIEFILNKDRKVLRVISLNADAKSFAGDSALAGKHVDESIKILLDKVNKSGLLKEDRILLISASLKNEENSEELDNLIKSLKSSVNSLNHHKLKIVTVKAEPSDIEESRKRNISMGKNVLSNRIKSKQSSINVEEVSNMPLSDIVQMYWLSGGESSDIDIGDMYFKDAEAAKKPEPIHTTIPQKTAVQSTTTNSNTAIPTVVPKVGSSLTSTPKVKPTPTIPPQLTPTAKLKLTPKPKPTVGLKGIVLGKYYKIIAKHSGKVMSVEDGTMDESENILQKTFANDDSQLWKIEPVSGIYYKITVKHSGKCLSVRDNGMKNGTGMAQLEYKGTDDQLFTLKEVEPGYYAIISKLTGKCADVVAEYTGENVSIWQWDYLGGDNQKWEIRD